MCGDFDLEECLTCEELVGVTYRRWWWNKKEGWRKWWV